MGIQMVNYFLKLTNQKLKLLRKASSQKRKINFYYPQPLNIQNPRRNEKEVPHEKTKHHRTIEQLYAHEHGGIHRLRVLCLWHLKAVGLHLWAVLWHHVHLVDDLDDLCAG